jgi:DNA-directed RNA polymerase specialized sigma24 family protein
MEREPTEFAEFYEATRDDCLRIVLLNVGDRHLAHDLVAEAYTRAWMSWRKVRDLEVPRAWVGAHRAERARVLVAPPSA